MIVFLLVVTWVLALIVSRWFGLMALVVLGALWRRAFPDRSEAEASPSTRFLFVIPAHDESTAVGVTVRSCLAVDYDPALFQVVVIADNCTDDTASIAAEAGALVVVRVDPERKSKGFALEDFFRDAPSNAAIRPPDAFVLVDADTSVASDVLQVFDGSIRRGDDFVQGYYTVRNADASWRTRLMTYAFSLANGVWPAGLDALGLSVGLKGNGMCFRAAALRRFPWRAYGLVEDMEFAWHLRLGGERVRFEPRARVYGEMVSRGGPGAASQRRRWESGRKLLRTTFGRLLRQSPRLSWPEKVAYQADLDMPPLGRLIVSLGLVSTLAILGIASQPWSAAWVTLVVLLLAEWGVFCLYAVCPLLVVGLPLRYLLSLACLPYYLIWKVSIGLMKAPQQWVRTPREDSSTKSLPS